MIKSKIKDIVCFLLGSAVLPLIANELVYSKEEGLSFEGAFIFVFIIAYVLFFFIKKKVFVEEKWWKVFLWFLWFYFSICGLVSLFI